MEMEVKSIKDAELQNRALMEAKKKLNLTTAEGKKQNEAYNKTLNKNTEFIRANSDAATKQRMNIGNYTSALTGLPGPLGRAASGVQSFGKQLWALVANPIVAIVAAIVLAFTALYKIISSTDAGANALDAIFKSIGAIMDVVRRRVLMVVDGIKALFSGNFKEAGDKFAGSVKGIGEEMKNATNEAWNLVYAMDALEDAMTANISKQADYENKIAKLRVIAKDQTASDKERMDAAKQAMDLQKELADDQVKFATEAYNLALRDAARKTQIEKDKIDAFIKLDAEKMAVAVANDTELARLANELGDDGVKALEESYAKMIGADTSYFEGIRRQQSEYTGFVKEINAKRAEEAEAARLKQLQAERDANTILKAETLDPLVQIEQEKTDITLGELALRTTAQEEAAQAEIDLIKKTRDEKIKAAQEYVAMAADYGGQLFEINQMLIDNEVAKMEEAKAYELQMAGDNAEKREAIEKKYDKEAAKLKAKQAKQDKAQALFTAIIKTAQAVLAGLAYGPPLGYVFAALNAVLGAVQIGIISAQPIPQFAKGTESAPDGVISVAEKGQELIKTRSGRVLMATRPTLLSGMKGAQIYSNADTEALLKYRNIGYDSQDLKKTLESNNDKLIKTIRDKREIYITPPQGSKITARQGDYFRNYWTRKLG
jgi:hypothetical protein